MKCQAIMNPNMNKPQRKAMTVQINSTFSMGSFHQIRSFGGVTAMRFPRSFQIAPLRLAGAPCSFRQRDGGNLHHAPKDVEHRWNRYAEEQQQKRIIENPLHHRDALEFSGSSDSIWLCRRH